MQKLHSFEKEKPVEKKPEPKPEPKAAPVPETKSQAMPEKPAAKGLFGSLFSKTKK